MSESTRMYAMKPIVDIEIPVNASSQIYKMRNIHEVHQQNGNHSPSEDSLVPGITDQVTAFLKEPLPDLSILQERQMKILAQLSQLQQQIITLCNVIKPNDPKPSAEVCFGEPVNLEVSLTTSPKNVPFSVLALSKLWSDSVFQIQTHVHSSFTGTVPEFVVQKNRHKSQKNVIKLTIIWKNVPNLQVKIGVTTCTIIGEVNFLRYLCRSIPMHNYEYSDPVEINLINSIFDLCHILSLQSPKETQATISNLGDHLTEGPWLLNKKKPSIVDVAAWSLIKRLNSKLPPNLANWFDNCEKLFL